MNKSPKELAISILNSFGLNDLSSIDVLDVVYALDVPIKFVPMRNGDGRIVHGNNKSLITINDNIEFETRRRFTIAHELGHYLMHKDSPIHHFDNSSSMSWFEEKNRSKIAQQEYEANVFASELLLPSTIYSKSVQGEYFSPDLIRDLSDKFGVSRTSTIYRFIEHGNHPICVFYSKDNKVNYWKRSHDFRYRIKDCTKAPPPSDSVSSEYFDDGTIYSVAESKQEIVKSTWLDVPADYSDDIFYEFCLVYSAANLTISVIWED
jgi:Zn-dependent peptidase ImmA (M78 family)